MLCRSRHIAHGRQNNIAHTNLLQLGRKVPLGRTLPFRRYWDRGRRHTRLWSWAGHGTTVSPSVKQSNVLWARHIFLYHDALAGFSENLVTHCAPQRVGVLILMATVTPLPRASPALITIGAFFRIWPSRVKIPNTAYSAVGIEFSHKVLANSCALDCRGGSRGPKAGMPASLNLSTIPITSGSSGAATAGQVGLWQNSEPADIRRLYINAFAIFDMPPFPGAPELVYAGLCENFGIACSRPPPPIIRIFIIYGTSFRRLMLEMALARKYHRDTVLIAGPMLYVANRAARLDNRRIPAFAAASTQSSTGNTRRLPLRFP